MIYGLYTLMFGAALAGYAPAAVWRRLAHGVPLNLRARLGRNGSQPSAVPTAWVHAVSVGETIAAQPLADGVRQAYPELPLVITTVTETGARVARERFGPSAHRYFPLDLPGATRRVIAGINPAFFICMETELWPNTLRALAERGVPVMLANGRLSDRSFRRYRLVRPLLRPMLDDIRVFAMQSHEDARRIIALGARPERVFVTGNLKHEPVADTSGAELWHRLLGLRAEQRVWIAVSTHRGEEGAVLDAHAAARRSFPDVVLIVAPRHPERVGEVVRMIVARGWPAVRRSELPRERHVDAVIVLDTVGELAQLYAVGDVVFMGGSLVEAGGHNMIEAATRRKPVLFGPHTTNFRDSARLLVESGGGILVRDARELAAELIRQLADPELRLKLGAAAHDAVAARHGAVGATLDLVGRLLRPGDPREAV
jgi:3-deoxy-D-manno-octulosonic-acid transferase